MFPSQGPHEEPLIHQDRCHKQHECPVKEVEQVRQVAPASVSAPGPDGRYQIPVKVQGVIHQALLDSGSSQTLIYQSLVRPGALLDAS